MNDISQLNSMKAMMAALPSGIPSATQEAIYFNPDGTPAGKYPARKLLQDMANAGGGYGTCSTAATTAAKEVTIDNFILLKFGTIYVYFTSAINVAGATLNVSSSGAKPIKIMGATLQPKVVKARTIVQLVYDGTNWNIVNIFGLETSSTPSDLYVDMGLPSGLLWAKKNIDITQADGFAASEFQYECTFFSWGNVDGHNPSSTSAFTYNWGTSNDGPYASTPGAALTGSESPTFDAARVNLGAPWRKPTTGEFAELFANIKYIDANGDEVDTTQADKCVTVNDVKGLYLESTVNANRLFFPCSGDGYGQSWSLRGSYGNYWSSSFGSATNGRYLVFGSGGVYPQGSGNRFFGFAVRPVQ